MTKLLEQALEAVRLMRPAEQDAVAGVMLNMARMSEPLEIDSEHLAAVREGLAQAARSEFVDGDASDVLKRAFTRSRPSR